MAQLPNDDFLFHGFSLLICKMSFNPTGESHRPNTI